ncbi:MAG: hydantoinase B/oxoprolinase family protein [Proteobacteria bacterium]|nr:hydantoinase B/oxoprolinase family protein [Pseudomonadota bacterium]
MPSEKVLLEILNNRFTGIVEEMGYVIHRASFTVFVKETWDFDSALLTPEGEVFCYPRNIGVTNMLGIDMGPAVRCIDHLEPGDVIVTNDPHTTRGMCTHLPDIMLFKPLFFGGKLVCFAWCFVHSSDVGGLVPGSIAPTAYDRYQEGLTIPPTKLVKAGKLNDELLRIILANCRIPEQNWGDMKALLAALNIAERRIGQVVAQYGAESVESGIRGLMNYGEHRAREILRGIPDGEYRFADYIEVDFVTKYFVRINVRVVVEQGNLLLDFTGTDTQMRAAMNLPTYGRPNQWVVLGIVNFLRTSDRALPVNRGILRSVKVHIPEGTLLNPAPFVATGVRHTTGYRVSDAVLGALSQAAPERIPAAGAGQVAIVLYSHLDSRTGGYSVNVLQPMQGGCGGRPTKDGIDGVNFSAGSLRNVPTESIELEAPIVVNRYMLADKAAAGRYRGGSGVIFEFQSLAPNAIVTARGMDRFKLRPYGRKGAHPGSLGETLVNPGTAQETNIGKIDILKLNPGDVVRITAPGGAGYGDPLDRDPAMVLTDIENGFVSEVEAADVYGVSVANGRVDAAATKVLRERLTNHPSTEEFVFGPERMEYETRLPHAIQDLVAELLAAYPAATRQFLRDRLYARIEADAKLRSQPAAEIRRGLFALLEEAMAQGKSAMAAE